MAADADPVLVLTRTVQPRVAYRGLPADRNPAAATATTFPARVFHTTLGEATGEQLGDGSLGEVAGVPGLAGVPDSAASPGLRAAEVVGQISGSRGQPPIGPGATTRGAVSGITAGLGALVSGAVRQTRAGGGP
jgi:hypothetical protein